jgi:ATP-dependent DNA helicase RecG
MCKTSDGFKISEEDLRLRGPGDFFGSRQHGLPEMHVADLGADANVLQRAQDESRRILDMDPELSLPQHKALRDKVNKLFELNSAGFN